MQINTTKQRGLINIITYIFSPGLFKEYIRKYLRLPLFSDKFKLF